MTQERIPSMRIRLFRADPHCFWCGCEVRIDVPHATANLATLDHLYSRFHPERALKHRERDQPGSVLHVLACHACNHERGVCEMQRKPFIPKLSERLEFAQKADATLANRERQTAKVQSAPSRRNETAEILASKLLASVITTKIKPMRVIQTLQEAAEFARENPAR